MLLIYRGQCSAGIIAQAITRICTRRRIFAAPYPLSRLLAVSMPSGAPRREPDVVRDGRAGEVAVAVTPPAGRGLQRIVERPVPRLCGALSTASTFTSEFRMLKEAPHAPRG